MGKVILLAVLLMILIGAPLAAAHHSLQHKSDPENNSGGSGGTPGGSGGEGSGEEKIGTKMPSGSPLQETVPLTIEAEAKKYIISLVGEDYFSERFTFDVKRVFQDENGIKFYNIFYKFDVPFEDIANPGIESVAVSLDSNGKVTAYLGPKKAYKFLISKEEAIEIGKGEGLVNPGAVIDHILTEGLDMYVWVVTGTQKKDCVPAGAGNECFVRGIYVDVDSGDVLGSFGKSMLIETPGPGTASPEEMTGLLIVGIVIIHLVIMSVYYLKRK